MKQRRRMKESGGRSIKIVSYTVTIAFIIASLVPLAWLLSSSFKDSHSIYSYPPKWIPTVPKTVTITLDYKGQENQDRSFYKMDAMKAIWFSWKKNQNEPIGEIRIEGVRDGHKIYSAEMPAYNFQAGRTMIVPTSMFSNQVMKVKIPMIEKRGYTSFHWLSDKESDHAKINSGEGSQTGLIKDDSPAGKVVHFLKSSTLISGTPVHVQQKTDIFRIFDNYIAVFVKQGQFSGSYGFLHYLENSLFVTGMAILAQLLLGGMAGYALSHLTNRKWSVWLTLFFVATIMIPEVAILIPLYLTMTQLNLVDTLWGIILPHTAWGIVIFLFKGFFDQLPGDLLKAARVDGASEFRIFFQLVFPMSLPIFTVVAVMTFIPMWNEFLWPLVVAREQSVWTFTVALNHFQNSESMGTNLVMASMVLSTIPLFIIFLTCQRFIEKGVSWAGIKE